MNNFLLDLVFLRENFNTNRTWIKTLKYKPKGIALSVLKISTNAIPPIHAIGRNGIVIKSAIDATVLPNNPDNGKIAE